MARLSSTADCRATSSLSMLNYLLKAYLHLDEWICQILLWRFELAYWKKLENVVLEEGKQGYRIRTEALGIPLPVVTTTHPNSKEKFNGVIAEIDRNGSWLSYVGPIPDVETVTATDFQLRKRAQLQVVDVNGFIGVKKDYKGKYWSFVNELRSLHLLGKVGCCVPSIMCIDFNRPSLTTSYIKGKPLSDLLVKRGELLHTPCCDSHLDLEELSRREQIELCIHSARPFLNEIIDQQFVNHAFMELAKIHTSRLIWNDVKYGNIVMEKHSGKPYLIDFDHARYYPRLWSPLFKSLCENDKMKLNIRLSFDSAVFKDFK